MVAFLFAVGLQMSSDAAKVVTKKKIVVLKKVIVTKKVIPGGQNQLIGTEGKVGQQLFNGTSRFKIISVTFPTEITPGFTVNKDQRVIAIEAEVKNARKFTGSYGGVNCKLQLVDKDDQLFEKVYHVNRLDWKKRESPRRLLPAAGLKAFYIAKIPVEFNPVRLIYMVEPGVPVYRVNF